MQINGLENEHGNLYSSYIQWTAENNKRLLFSFIKTENGSINYFF